MRARDIMAYLFGYSKTGVPYQKRQQTRVTRSMRRTPRRPFNAKTDYACHEYRALSPNQRKEYRRECSAG